MTSWLLLVVVIATEVPVQVSRLQRRCSNKFVAVPNFMYFSSARVLLLGVHRYKCTTWFQPKYGTTGHYPDTARYFFKIMTRSGEFVVIFPAINFIKCWKAKREFMAVWLHAWLIIADLLHRGEGELYSGTV